MDLLQMEYFVRVAESPTMLRAAEELNVSQSTLSMSIKKLETELGTKLFRREGHGLKLTEAGRRFHEGASRILQETAALRQSIQSMVDSRSKTIVVAANAVDYALESVYLYSITRPDIAIEPLRANQSSMRSMLLSWQADFCLSLQPVEDNDIESTLLISEPMYLLASAESRFADVTSVSIRDLAGETLVSLHKGQAFRELCESYFSTIGLRPGRILEVGELEALSFSVRRRFGISFVPQSVQAKSDFHREHNHSLCTRPMQESFCYRNIYLSRRKNESLSPEHQAYLDFLLRFNAFVKTNQRMPAPEECL